MDTMLSQLLYTLRSQPLRLSVEVCESEKLKKLQAEYDTLRANYNRLEFSYSCVSRLLARMRDYCADNKIHLPPDLSQVTPWG